MSAISMYLEDLPRDLAGAVVSFLARVRIPGIRARIVAEVRRAYKRRGRAAALALLRSYGEEEHKIFHVPPTTRRGGFR